MKLLSHCLIAGIITLVGPVGAKAAVVGVTMRDNYYFTPTNIVIRPMDTVVWTNLGIRVHDTTHTNNAANPPLWRSGNVNVNATYAFVFTNVGYYPYWCQQHRFAGPQQTGTVTVVNISLASATRTQTNAQFTINGGRQGLKAVVEAGGQLGTWSPIATNTFPAAGMIRFTNNAPPPTNRFYRARVIP